MLLGSACIKTACKNDGEIDPWSRRLRSKTCLENKNNDKRKRKTGFTYKTNDNKKFFWNRKSRVLHWVDDDPTPTLISNPNPNPTHGELFIFYLALSHKQNFALNFMIMLYLFLQSLFLENITILIHSNIVCVLNTTWQILQISSTNIFNWNINTPKFHYTDQFHLIYWEYI